DADVVHCHDVFFWYLPFRFLFPRKRIFTTFHGYETNFPPTLKAKAIRKLSELLSNGNICVGDYIKKWYGTKTNFITYGGTDYSIKDSTSAYKSNAKVKLLFVGRIEKDNGVDKYAEILESLKKNKIPFSFEACGDGGMRYIYKKYGRVNGFVKNVNNHIQNSDVVFASSYLSILESLASKKAVVSTYSNNLKKDYLTMSPFKKFITIVGPEDSIKPGFKLKASEGGYKWAREQTWDKVTALYVKLWRMS
ncbi:MAG TPA: glycosyltransferase, partial [Patescibacteria group bacterium]|nr:glycosyltransferase [Patescibacteria group bacterium]